MKLRLFTGLLSLSLLLAACFRNGASTNVNLTISDFHFTPDRITVPAGREITLHVDNEGFVSHQFAIFKLGTSPEDKFDASDKENVYWMFEILPGHNSTTTFTAPGEAGEYYIACGIFGHLEAGMIGKLVVVEDN